MGKFKKGLFLGSLLGAGMTWLMTTQKGKEVREQMLDYAADVYSNVRKELLETETYDKLTKSRYMSILTKYVDTYAIENGLAKEVKEMIIKVVGAQWKNVREELQRRK